jgi:hypothetical protein
MKSAFLISSGALFVVMTACGSTSSNPPAPGTGGAKATGGSSVGTGGALGSGGSVGSGGASDGTGGTIDGSGGSVGSGGSTASGGSVGSGGSTASGGQVGSGGVGTGGANASGGAPATLAIRGTFGSFDNAFMITPCQAPGSGFDCPNLPQGSTNCPTAPWSYGAVTTAEATGSTYTEVFTVTGGDPTKTYDITVHVLGQAEGRTYTGGTRALTANVDPTAASNNLLYTGGRPGTTRVDYNVFQLLVEPGPGGAAIPGAATYFAFNAVDAAHEGNHYNYALDETFTMKVKTGFVLTLTSHDSNCVAIKNCGPGGPYGFASAAACEAIARSTPASVTLPATFRGTTISNPAKFQTQFVNFKITSMVAN